MLPAPTVTAALEPQAVGAAGSEPAAKEERSSKAVAVRAQEQVAEVA